MKIASFMRILHESERKLYGSLARIDNLRYIERLDISYNFLAKPFPRY
jgi:hypothetical protein